MTTPTDRPRVDVPRQGARSRERASIGTCIQGRYQLQEEIGRGGMAIIYRVTDLAQRQEIALKQLVGDRAQKHYTSSAAAFEREFHTLAELSHPRVIKVYDYGLDEHGPFYTMELLDGGDLRTLSPLPWATACSQIYDVCSSLALIHSRRLVHRDVSPGNVRCTRDGQAKLIDFGAMVPMGQAGLAVGTPQFVAPEVVHGSSLDARTDLFSLGATFYFALTRRSPYPARDFASLELLWNTKPAAPSQFAPDVPAALDALILAMIAVEPAMRPRTAFEVMQRLAAIAGIERAEPISVSRAYLATPRLLGREAPMAAIRAALTTAFEGRGGSVMICSAAGLGRSRLLDDCALVAKTLGATVLRASGNAGAVRSFRVAASLAQQLEQSAPDKAWARARKDEVFDTLFEPEATGDVPLEADVGAAVPSRLRDFGANPSNRFAVQSALSGWMLAMARRRPIVIAIDDFPRIDEPSAALLAALASRADHRRLCIIVSAESGAEPNDRLAFDVLAKHSVQLTLTPLASESTEQLLESVFGDVPNLAIVSAGVHAIAAGNPRATLDLAQHLVDRGLVRYERGGWTLPVRLESSDLPSSAEEAMRARLTQLSVLSRWLAEAQALATYQAFTRADYAKLRSDANATEIDRAMTELLTQQVVVSDGSLYTLAHRGWCTLLTAPLTAAEHVERHRALSVLYEGRPGLGVVRHALLADMPERALDELAPLLRTLPEANNVYETTDLSPSEIAATFGRALSAAEQIGRSERELNELRRWLASLSVVSDDAYYQRVAPAWLERLKHDSGYTLWQQSEIVDPQARLGSTMQQAFERYAATPEAERVYRPDEAIKALAHYVGISLAIGSSRVELATTNALPALLEPFAPLSGLIHAIWQNAIAAREASCRAQPERARQRWRDVYGRLSELDATEPQFVGVFRRAVAHAIGSSEASMGIADAAAWADVLDDDPVQRVNSLNLRRIVRMQQGDWEGAERLRRRGEMLRLQTRARQMFSTLTAVELLACAMAGDLTGLKQVSERVAALAARSAGWMPVVQLAEGHMHLLCDSYPAALAAFERGSELLRATTDPSWVPVAYCPLVAGQLEAMIGLDCNHDARSAGEEAVALCKQREVGVLAHGIVRALALAEARTGDLVQAAARIEAVIDTQNELAITGLHLGASYEARTRVAILAHDESAIAHFATLTAREYRHGRNSPLGARYERLMQDARRSVDTKLPALADYDRLHESRVTGVASDSTSGSYAVGEHSEFESDITLDLE